jgi:hypothetical protein
MILRTNRPAARVVFFGGCWQQRLNRVDDELIKGATDEPTAHDDTSGRTDAPAERVG